MESEPVNGVCHAADIPNKQWAQVFAEQGSGKDRYCRLRTRFADSEALIYTQIPVPPISADEVLVQIKYSGVCHSDLHAWKGAGVVVARGNNVSRVSVGDQVGIQWVNGACERCEFCKDGDQQLCSKARISGYTTDGTFQQFCVCRATNVVRIPDGMPLHEAAPILCAGITVYKALKESHLKPGQTVAIAGAGGGLGSFACQYAKALGYRVLALSSGLRKRAMLVDELDVDYFVDYNITPEGDLAAEIQKLTEGGPHAAIVVSSVEAPIAQAIQYVRPKGTVVVVGLPKNAVIQADVFSTVCQEKVVKGSYVGSVAETEDAMRIYMQNRFPIQNQKFPLKELPTVFERMEQGTIQGRAILEIPSVEAVAPSMFAPSQYNLGTFLAYRLEQIGVKDCFYIPGDFNLILLDQILQNPALRMVGCCNELNAGYAADGYARSSPSKVAVVFVTFMVGGLSLLNAIAGAYSERLRVIVVSGAPPSNTYGQDSLIHHSTGLKDRDQALRIFEQVTASSIRLERDSDPTSKLDHALTKCLEDSLPVYIEIPSDMSDNPCNSPGPLPCFQSPTSTWKNMREAFDRFQRDWKMVQNPVIIVGPLARHALTRDMLVGLINKLGCPVFSQPDAKSLVPECHPQFHGTFWGTASGPVCWEMVMVSDLWVSIGTRWNDFHLLQPPTPPVLELQIDHLRATDGRLINGFTMSDLCDLLIHSTEIRCHAQVHNPTHMLRTPAERRDGPDPPNQPLQTTEILKVIENILQPNDSLIADAGDSWFNAQAIRLPQGVDFQIQFMYGSIGWSLPATLGSQLARPQGRTILMIGDGSFQMTAQEVSTMIRLRTNSIIFIFNNLGYRIESAIHDGPYNYISNWNYALLAETMCNVSHSPRNGNKYLTEQEKRNQDNPRLVAMRIKTRHDLLIAAERVMGETDRLFILECCIDPWDISDSLAKFSQAVGRK
ncbi:hypothetical protein BDV26DRAFT_303971 [Aspergillus bertholletiae]|uniref:Pyruvate decarboxylase n=1 Tax=Aspergillus bertholletiae TaxID=1226010 RepID=A0A5N7BN24_9EURO|nr:hypothetical protein BDV26DRAFT_303971 [Aspergillus bertholletiae]